MVHTINLIERDDQIAALDEQAAASCDGKGQLALICGAPTTGCTSLLEAFTERAASRHDMILLAASCSLQERALPGGVLSQLLDAPQLLSPGGSQVKELVTTIVRHTAEFASDTKPDAELTRLFHDLCLRLRELAAERPLLIAVDDAAFADTVSLCFLQRLIPWLPMARIMVALTRCIRDFSQRPVLPAGFHLLPYARLIILTPLSREGVHALLKRRHSDAEADRLAAKFYGMTGGNPVLLQALLESVGHEDEHNPYGLAFLDCLNRYDPLLLEIARPLAVLGEEARDVPLNALIDVDQTAIDWALDRLAAAGLVENSTFRHRVAHEAILERLTAEERTTMHRRAADALAKSGAPASVVARHLASAGSPPPWGVAVLRDAASQMVADQEPWRASQYLELAMRGADDAAEEAALRIRLAQIDWTLDPASAVRHLSPLMTAFKTRHLGRWDSLTLIRLLLWYGRTREASEVLDLARNAAEAPPEAIVESEDLELWLAYTHPGLARVRKSTGSGFASGGVRALAPLADRCLRATAALVRLQGRGRYGPAEDRALRVVRDLSIGRRTGWTDEWLLAALPMLIGADRLHDAAECCEQLIGHCDGNASPIWQAILAATQAEIALGWGNLEVAAEDAERAMAELPPTGWGVAIGLPRSILIAANTRMGRLDKTGTELAYPVPEAMFQSRYGLYYLHERGHYHLTTGHHHAALADFLSCGELVRTWGLDGARLVPWRSSAAEACLGLGDKERARRLAGEHLAQPGNGTPRSRARALRMLAMTSPARQRPQMMMEALELFESCGDQFEQARTLASLCEAYQALNDNRRARMVFRRGLYMAGLCGANPLYWNLLSIGEMLGEAPSTIEPNDKLAELSESEQRVAALAALGYTNRDIAGKLYVTPSTVEQHLTRVYRKLNISHRRELPADLAIRGQPTMRSKGSRHA